jgi:tetratricopeptide (TPR) repeat protein
MAVIDASPGVLLVETTLRGEHAVRVLPAAPRTSTGWRRLADPHTLALAYYNRGVAELRNGRFAAAAASNLAALRLDPNYDPARMNLDVILNNWSVRLAGEGRFDEAVRLLANCHGDAARRAAEQNRRYIAFTRSMAAAGP